MTRTLLLVLTLAFGATALAAPPDGGREGPPGPPPHEILIDKAAELGLDADTVTAIQTLADEARPELETLHEQARESHAREDIKAVMEREKLLMDEIMGLLSVEHRQAAKELLPPPPPRPGERPPQAE